MHHLRKTCAFHATFFPDLVEDEVPLRYQTGHFEDALFFTPHTPKYPEVDLAVGVLNPISVEFHQVHNTWFDNECRAVLV